MRPAPTFEYCALHYANMWQRDEKAFAEGFHEGDRDEKMKSLTLAAKHFRITRNFHLKHLKNRQLGHVILKELDNLNLSHLDSAQVVDTVGRFERALSNCFEGRRFYSAASKFLWVKIRSPVVIYDAQARAALKSPHGNYADFVARWRDDFDKHRDRIAAACDSLPSMWKYCFDASPEGRRKLAVISTESWFHDRVFDDYLWHVGAGKAYSAQ